MEGFSKCLGLVITEKEDYVYLVVNNKNKTNMIVKIDTQSENIVHSYLLPEIFFFNGLALHNNTLYTTNEDAFLPNKGLIYYINLDNETDSGIF